MKDLLSIVKSRYKNLNSASVSSSLSYRETQKWVTFGENRHKNGTPVRKDLVKFIIEHGNEIKTATEIGCGGFIESLYLAKHGIKTTGIDGVINWNLFNSILNNPQTSPEIKNNLSVQEQNFSNLMLEKSDLICSFCSLPFCPKEDFGNMLANIVNAVNPNGYLLLHFFGQDHPFVQQGRLTGFNSEQLESAFSQLGFETSCYEYTSEKTAMGEHLPSMTNIVITAQAPEQTIETTPETINTLLGFEQPLALEKQENQNIELPSTFNKLEEDFIESLPYKYQKSYPMEQSSSDISIDPQLEKNFSDSAQDFFK